jgi:hypothetical protein
VVEKDAAIPKARELGEGVERADGQRNKNKRHATAFWFRFTQRAQLEIFE